MIRKIALVLFFLVFSYCIFKENLLFAAEGGARPISMGGAFIAVADDVHCASWNPAGMAWQEDTEITYSGILNNRDKYVSCDFISDDYISMVYPIKTGYQHDFKVFGTVGMYFHRSGFKRENTETKLYQPGISYAKKVFNENTAVGVAVNYYGFDATIPDGSGDYDSALSFNLSFLYYYNDKLTFGCLWENINEPMYSIFGNQNRLVRVLRPGLAYYINSDTVVTLDIYDLTGNTSDRGIDLSQDLRVGFEHYLTELLSVRLGAHHFNSHDDINKSYSFGLGWQRSDFLGIYPINYYFDYGFVYWQDAPGHMDDYTHQISVTLKF